MSYLSHFYIDLEAKTGTVERINLKQSLKVLAGLVVVSPRFDVGTKAANVGVSYSLDTGTSVNIDSGSKRVTIAQFLGERNVIIPSLSMAGDFDVSYQRMFNNWGKITTSFRPKESINVQWEGGPWVANVHAPMEGYTKFHGVDFSFRRQVDV